MFNSIYLYVVPLLFSLCAACFLTALVSGLMLLAFKLRKTNELFQHPYLAQQPFHRYPLSIRAAILMDYFLRICFPRSQFWVMGQANRLLGHVNPQDIPTSIKWPLVGLWGGCYIGLCAMALFWTLLLLRM